VTESDAIEVLPSWKKGWGWYLVMAWHFPIAMTLRCVAYFGSRQVCCFYFRKLLCVKLYNGFCCVF